MAGLQISLPGPHGRTWVEGVMTYHVGYITSHDPFHPEIFVPDGAVPVGTEANLGIRVLQRGDEDFDGHRHSEIVECRPHGMTFLKPIMLSIPLLVVTSDQVRVDVRHSSTTSDHAPR